MKQSLTSTASEMCFLTWGPHDNNGATLFSGVRKIGLLNCPNTLEQDHLMEQNLNEISLSATLMDCAVHQQHALLEISAQHLTKNSAG